MALDFFALASASPSSLSSILRFACGEAGFASGVGAACEDCACAFAAAFGVGVCCGNAVGYVFGAAVGDAFGAAAATASGASAAFVFAAFAGGCSAAGAERFSYRLIPGAGAGSAERFACCLGSFGAWGWGSRRAVGVCVWKFAVRGGTDWSTSSIGGQLESCGGCRCVVARCW